MVPHADIQRSGFNRSSTHKTTFNFDYLVPVFLDEVLPGDTFDLTTHTFARLATPLVPIMDNLYLDSFYFYVPYRLLSATFKNLMGEEEVPGEYLTKVPTGTNPWYMPKLATGSTLVTMDMGDYFGLPLGTTVATDIISALPFRAYNLIWNEWFRDENLQGKAVFTTGAGPDTYADYVLRRRGKRHDYFTSCLPFPQKAPSVALPLGTRANILADQGSTGYRDVNLALDYSNGGGPPVITKYPMANYNYTIGTQEYDQPSKNWVIGGRPAGGPVSKPYLDPTAFVDCYKVDLSGATASTINDLRRAFQIQKMYERDARGGSRYTEIIRSHFGVVSPDARLQRPEFLGGGSSRLIIHAVEQNSATPSTAENAPTGTPQGNLAAFGLIADTKHGFKRSFTEHGLIIGLVAARADITYQQGIHRMWRRQLRTDFYWPALAHLGEQSVLNQEIFRTGGDGVTDLTVFGYQERWAEYRYSNNRITGKFRSGLTDTLDYWHMAESFASVPSLNAAFIQSSTPERALAIKSTGGEGAVTAPNLIADFHFNLNCVRPMPVYSVPGLIDHF
ncbi:MAG: major capsid protein [Arizlama microvirus]|nr:MAG: major capsid protein [Arizlama microvirus]